MTVSTSEMEVMLDLRRFISSPSKSALYGLQTHSLRRNVRHGRTLTYHPTSVGSECVNDEATYAMAHNR
jgi:hypothetical protein